MTDSCAVRASVTQCKSCPWRVDCIPDKDIPRYKLDLHLKLADTIRSGAESLRADALRVMSCHYSKEGDEFPCAGWIENQLGVGNNIGVRMQVMRGRMPRPIVDGEQHERFEDTLPKSTRKRATRRR